VQMPPSVEAARLKSPGQLAKRLYNLSFTVRLTQKATSGRQIVFTDPLDARFADPEMEIGDSLRPCRIFPFYGDYRRRLV
jgi:hypothetical protein